MDARLPARVLALAEQIQQIPAPTFEENRRAEFIRIKFADLGAKDVFMDERGNVYTLIKGRGEKPPVVISAHLDTVFPMETALTISRTQDRICGPGIGDNSLGLAALFGLYWAFSGIDADPRTISAPAGDVWLVANVCEEGLGDLKGMKAVVNRFGQDVLAYIILEGMPLGQVHYRGLGVRRYSISVHTKGGHSWVDFGNPSAIHELAELVVKIKNLALPSETRTSLNVGVISGGTSVNTIAAHATLQLDLRSESKAMLAKLVHQVEELVAQAHMKGGEAIQVEAKIIGDRPAGEIPADHPLVKLAVKCLAEIGIEARLNIGSTDANEPLSQGLPAICVGLTTGGGTHTIDEYIDIKPVEKGLGFLVKLVHAVFQESRLI
jgi:acetylornithine deacetylase/succinyl-diaminopimelate desuccinylase-like protein